MNRSLFISAFFLFFSLANLFSDNIYQINHPDDFKEAYGVNGPVTFRIKLDYSGGAKQHCWRIKFKNEKRSFDYGHCSSHGNEIHDVTLSQSGSYVLTYFIIVGPYSGSKAVTTKVVSFDINIDTAKPTAPSISASPGSWTNGNTTLRATSTDYGSGVRRIEILRKGIWVTLGTHVLILYPGNYEGFVDTTKIAENGKYYIRAVDWVGNISDESTIEVTNIDRTAQILNQSGNSDNWTQYKTLSMDYNETGGVGFQTLQYCHDNVNWINASHYVISPKHFSYNVFSSGTYYFRYIDKLGNPSNSVGFNVTRVDQDLPTIYGLTKTRNDEKNTVLINMAVADSQSGIKPNSLVMRGSYNAVYKPVPSLPLTVTDHGTYEFKVTDNVGRESAVAKVVIGNDLIDKQAPNLIITKGPQSGSLKIGYPINLSSTTLNISGSALDLKNYWVKYNDKEDICSTPYEALNNGTYSFYAADRYGNRSPVQTVTVTCIDEISPVISFNGGEKTYYKNSVVLNVTDTVNGVVGVGIDPESLQVKGYSSKNLKYNYSEGKVTVDIPVENQSSNTLNFSIKDLKGNERSFIDTVMFDSIAPEIEKVIIAETSINSGKYKLFVADVNDTSGVDHSSLEFRTGAGSYKSVSGFTLEKGEYYELDFKISDNAGNVREFNQKIDLKDPVITDDFDTWYKISSDGSGQLITLTAADDSLLKPDNPWTLNVTGSIADIYDKTVRGKTLSFRLRNFKNKEIVVNVEAEDIHGNAGKAAVTVKYDGEKPRIRNISLKNDADDSELFKNDVPYAVTVKNITTPWVNKEWNLFIDAEDNITQSVKIEYKRESDTNYLAYDNNSGISIADDLLNPVTINSIDIRLTDNAGNKTGVTVNVRKDKIPPTFSTASNQKISLENYASKRQFNVDRFPYVNDTNGISSGFTQVESGDIRYLIKSDGGSKPAYTVPGWAEFISDDSGVYFAYSKEGAADLYIKYTDPAGNSSVSDRIDITIDNNGPKINNIGSFDNIYVNNNKLTLSSDPTWFDAGTNSSVIKEVQYYISDREIYSGAGVSWVTLNNSTIEFNTINKSSGSYYIYFSAKDTLGNTGYSYNSDVNKQKLEFIVDNEKPTVKGLKSFKLVNGKYIEMNSSDYSPVNTVYLKPEATDVGNIITGVIETYNFERSSGISGNYLNINNSLNSDGYYKVELSNGINYVKCYAIDRAGNKSTEETIYPVVIDSGVPTNLELRSKTHPRAISYKSAVSNSNPVFRLSANTGASGVKHYRYTLSKGTDTDKTVMPGYPKYTGENGRHINIIELTSLADNYGNTTTEEYEFYYLTVTAVAGNNREGVSEEYRFRIDTTPPTSLTINSSTHPIERDFEGKINYYNSTSAVFYWKEPQDLTGISKYYYKYINKTDITDSELSTLVVNTESAEVDKYDFTANGFSDTNKRELVRDLKEFVGNDNLNNVSVYLVLCAEDWAGERQTDAHLVSYETEAPVLTGLTITTSPYKSNSKELFDIEFSWDVPVDRFSGILNQEIFLQSYDELSSSFVQVFPQGEKDSVRFIPFSQNRQKVYGLEKTGASYKVTIYVYDNAGNKLTKNHFFDENGQTIPPQNFSIPFDDYFYDYRVKGQTLNNSWAELYLPAALGLLENNSSIGSVKLDLGTSPIKEFTKGRYFLNSSDIGFTIGGFNFNSDGLILDERGLSIRNPGITLPKVYFKNKVLGLFPVDSSLEFRGESTVISPNYLAFKNLTTSSVSGLDSFFSTNNWNLEYLSDLQFGIESRNLVIKSAYLPKDNGVVKTYSGESPVLLNNIKLNSSWEVEEADIEVSPVNPFIIETVTDKIRVFNGILRGDKIIIKSGEFIVDNIDISTETIKVNNLIVSNRGAVSKGNKFSYDDFTYEIDGTTFTADSLDFNENGIAVGGSFNLIGQPVTYKEQLLNKNGIDLVNKGLLSENLIIDDFGGMTLTGYNVELVGNTIIISEGSISLGEDLTGNTNLTLGNKVEPLIIKTSNFSVLSPGEWNLINGETSGSAYGNGLSIMSIKLLEKNDVKSILFPQIEITSPNCIMADSIIVNNTPLNRDKTFGISEKVDGYNFTVGDFSYSGSGVWLNKDRVVIDEMELKSSQNYLNSLCFTDFSYNGNGVITVGKSAETTEFSDKGRDFSLTDFVMDGDFLKSTGTYYLPEILGGNSIVFDKFILKSGGIYETAQTTKPQFMYIGGWRVVINSVKLDGDNLVLGEGTIRLYSSMADKELTFNNLPLDSAGNIVDPDKQQNEGLINFLSTNGYKVEAKGFALSEDGILLKGRVLLPELMQNDENTVSLDYDNCDILLKPSGEIVTLSEVKSLKYMYSGFYINGDGLTITEDCLVIKDNKLIVQTVLNRSLGEIEFYSDGEIKEGGYNKENFKFEIFNKQVILNVRAIGITKDGVNLKSFVTLPKGFIAEEMFFDSLTLHSNGTITSDLAVPKLSFKKFDTEFEFSEIYLDNDGFSIGSGKIVLPYTMDNKIIELSSFRIDSNGDFELESAYISPFELWGYKFYLDNIGYKDEVISLKGGVRLPSDFPIDDLKSNRFNIDTLEVSLKTGNTKFEISNNEAVEFKLFDKWDAVIEKISLDNDFKLKITKGWVELPKEFNTLGGGFPKLTINEILLDPVNNTYDVKSVEANNLSYEYGGLDFAIETVTLSHDRGLDIINGSVKIPKNDPLDPKYPEGIDGLILNINKFQITNDFEVDDFDVSLLKTERTSFFNRLFYLNRNPKISDSQGWMISLAKNDDGLDLAVSGSLELGDRFPEGIRGRSLDIGDCLNKYGIVVDITTGKIKRFIADSNFRNPDTGIGLEYKLFGNSMETGEISVNYDDTEQLFSVSVNDTSLTFDSSQTPDFLKNKIVNVNKFTIDQSGTINKFDVDIILNERKEIFNNSSIFIDNWRLGIKVEEDKNRFVFSVVDNGSDGNIVELGDRFPEGISGTKTSVKKFLIDSRGNLGDFDLNMTLSPELDLFGKLGIRGLDPDGTVNRAKGAEIRFAKDVSGKDFEVTLRGAGILSDSLPSGFANLEIPIEKFKFNSNGTIDLKMGISNLNVTVFDAVTINNGKLMAAYSSKAGGEIIFNINGDIILPDTVKNNLNGLERLTIDKLEISSSKGITAFDAYVKTNIKVDLYADMNFTFTSVGVADNGIKLSGTLFLPESFAKGLPSQIDLNNFEMNWRGEITDINAGISSRNLNIGGFSARVNNFSIGTDKINIERVTISVPDVGEMTLPTISFVNAGFNYKGEFFGKCEVTSISTPDIAGFRMVFDNPDLDVANREVSFSRVYTKVPDFLDNLPGGEVTLDGVNITTSGINITGGEIDLGTFNIGDRIGFDKAVVGFKIDGGKYEVSGHAILLIPGSGTHRIEADLAFKTPTGNNPLGIKRAYIEWSCVGGGIPIAQKLFINRLGGGVYTGAPKEVPSDFQYMFSKDGYRIRATVGLGTDEPGQCDVTGRIWIDTINPAVLVQGTVSVMNDMFTTTNSVAINDRGFAVKMNPTLNILTGELELQVFKYNNSMLTSGRGRLGVHIKKGKFFDEGLGPLRVQVPPWSTTLYGPSIEAGRFTVKEKYKNGVKGSVDAGIFGFGHPGVFVDTSANLSIGNVSKYKLITMQTPQRSLNSSALFSRSGKSTPDSRVMSLDSITTEYASGLQYLNINNSGSIDRILVMAAFIEGDPVVTFTSPSGRIYSSNDPGVNVIRYNNYLTFSIFEPEDGQWSYSVDKMISPDSYKVYAMEVPKDNEVSIEPIGSIKKSIHSPITLKGSSKGLENRPFRVLASEDNVSYYGYIIGESSTDDNGDFEAVIDPELILDGETFIFVDIDGGKMLNSKVYADGSLYINNVNSKLPGVTNLIAYTDSEDNILVSFKPIADNNRLKSYQLEVADYETGKILLNRDLGLAESSVLRGLPVDGKYSVSVWAEDSNNKKGYSAEVLYEPVIQNNYNYFDVKDSYSVEIYPGDDITLPIELTVNNLNVTDEASGYIFFENMNENNGLVLVLDQQIVKIDGGTLLNELEVYAKNEVDPGEYISTLKIHNLGNKAAIKTVELTINVLSPPVTINNVVPATWYVGDSESFQLFGSGFVKGTKLYIDDKEIPTFDRRIDRLSSVIPDNLNNGTVTVKVESGGIVSEKSIEVIGPTWSVYGHKQYSEILSGESTAYYFKINGENNFNGSVPLSVINLPTELSSSWSNHTAREGEVVELIINTPDTINSGIYNFEVSDSISDISFVLNIKDGGILPRISSLSEFSIIPGDELIIYGYGFSDFGSVFIDNKEQSVVSWSNDKILIKTDPAITNGDIRVAVNGQYSNTIDLGVKTRGFSIYPQEEFVKLQPGDSRTISIALSGYSDSVSLSLVNENSLISAGLTNTFVELNGHSTLEMSAYSSIPNGVYKILLTGSDGYSNLTKEIEIIIGDSFEFVTEEIPSFLEGVDSSFKLKTRYGKDQISFRLADNSILPLGLYITDSGYIKGRVSNGAQNKLVKIEAIDGENRVISKEFMVNVIENSWPKTGKDGGHGSFNPVPAPAELNEKWNKNIKEIPLNIIVDDNKCFVRTSGSIIVLDFSSGLILKRIYGDFKDCFVADSSLFTIDTSNKLTAWNYGIGVEKWSRDNVIHYTTDLNTLIVEDSESIKVIDIYDGKFLKKLQVELGSKTLWFNNQLLVVGDDSISVLSGSLLKNVFLEAGYSIHSVVADSESLLVLSDNGVLLTLDQDFKVVYRTELDIFQGDIVLNDKKIIVYSDGLYLLVDRNSYDVESFNSFYGRVVSASEVFFIYGNGGLEARNIYSGNIIWNKDASTNDLVIVGDQLYSTESNGEVICYYGRYNIYPPTTTVKTTPKENDGRNGYYVTTPIIEIDSIDPETFTEIINYRYADLEYSEYTEAIELPDGEYSFSAYGVDSKMLPGERIYKSYMVDTVAPKTLITRDYSTGENDFVTSEVLYTLSATDEISGVEEIYYTLNGETNKYREPVSIREEGEYTFSWWSEDRAGNVEDISSETISIDLNAPQIFSEYYEDDEYGIIYLSAEDTFSGINRIEYRVNGGDIINYVDPVALPSGSYYNVLYRAVDESGRSSLWINEVYDLSEVEEEELFKDFTTLWQKGDRYIDKDLQVGDTLYNRSHFYNKIDSLPEYLVGGEYIVGNYNDKYSWSRDFYWFTAGYDMEIYLIKNRKSRTMLDKTWVEIDRDVEISKGNFRGGAVVYYKEVKKGTRVTIGGTAMWEKGGANLIVGRRSTSSRLKIFSPNPDKIIYPLSTNWYASTKLSGEISRNWSYRVGSGEWQDISNSFSGEFTLPYLKEDSILDIRVQVLLPEKFAADETRVVEASRSYEVKNLSGVTIYEPVSGSQVLKNIPRIVDYKVTDYKGDNLPNSINFVSKNAAVVGEVIIPEETGEFEINWSNRFYEDHFIDGNIKLNSVDNYTTETFLFNTNLTGKYRAHSDGRYYGFTRDFKSRVGETTYVVIPEGKYWSKERITKQYIALEDGSEFDYLVNNGLYRVKLLVGPLSRSDYPYLSIESNSIDIDTVRRKHIYSIEATVDVKDHRLTLKGSNNMQIISMDVLRVDKEEPVTVKRLKNYRVLTDQRWYLWNPGHYYPDFRWDYDKNILIPIENKNYARGEYDD